MASTILKCRVCGKEYNACLSAKSIDTVFKWKRVACSEECGAAFVTAILKSRGQLQEQAKDVMEKSDSDSELNEDYAILADDDDDDDLEDDFEDEDEEIEIEL